jgi:NAD(P)H-dependent flavin oxidoreductase YrpB (nitropropane dioxygenase family)
LDNLLLRNKFTEEFALRLPLMQGPMGGVSGPNLVAAVAQAGALAVLPIWSMSVAAAIEKIAETQSLTSKAFAVNIRADLIQHEHIHAAVDQGISIIHLFWGDPAASSQAIPNGIKMIATVWDEASAKAALDAGACALIAQGVEAGGHVLGTTRLQELIPAVCSIAGDVPVAAAGGLATAEDIKQVFALGARAAVFGTRFVATTESNAHRNYKAAIVNALEDTTVRTECFDGAWPNAPHRVLRNSTFTTWEKAGSPAPPNRPGEGDVILHTANGQSIPRYFISPPAQGMTGEIEAAVMYAGTGIGKIQDNPAVATLIEEIRVDLLAG